MRNVRSGTKDVLVLDTWAMLAYLQQEPGAVMVREVLRKARRKQVAALFCLVNYGECLYISERRRGVMGAQQAINVIDQLAVSVVTPERSLVFAAARIKARHPISFADAFAAALAKEFSGTLLTGDPEFRHLEREVSIRWLA